MNAQPQWLFEAPLAHEAPGGQLSPPQQPHVRPGQPIDASTGPDLLNAAQVARAVPRSNALPICLRDVRYKESVNLACICCIRVKRDKPAAAL